MTEFWSIFVPLVLIVLAVVTFRNRFWNKYVIQDIYWALDYQDGSFVKLLKPGVYWKFGESKLTYAKDQELGFLPGGHATARQEIILIDNRSTLEHVTGQEVLTKDNLGIKVSLSAQFRVADAVVAFQKTDGYRMLLHNEIQLILRSVVSTLELEELLASRDSASDQVQSMARERLAIYGLEVEQVAIRDIMLSKELRSSFVAVVAARKEGEAALERARGETAALRNLANATQAVKNNPELLQLRILQAMSAGEGGNTIVVGMSPNAALGLDNSRNET